MNPKKLIRYLREHGINLKISNGKLSVDAPKNMMNTGILEKIRANRGKLIDYISRLRQDKQLSGSSATELSAGFCLSEGQKQIWTVSKFEHGNSAYNVIQALLIKGELPIAKLESAFSKLLNRHEALRTIIEDTEDEPLQFVMPPGSVSFRIKPISRESEEYSTSAINKIVDRERKHEFRLHKAPLFRVSLVQFKNKICCLILNFHHIICDGISLNIIKRELSLLYLSEINKSSVKLPELSYQFKDLLRPKRMLLKNSYSEKRFWNSMFKKDLALLEMDGDEGKRSIPVLTGGFTSILIGKEVFLKFKRLCHASDSSLFVGVFALVNCLLYLESGCNDIVLGTATSGRSELSAENIVGMFVNVLAIRTSFSPDRSFTELLQKEKKILKKAFEHQNYPLSQLTSELKKKKKIEKNGLFDVMVVLHNHKASDEAEFLLDTLRVTELEVKPFNGNFNYTFNFTETSEGLRVELEYNRGWATHKKASLLLSHLKSLLNSIVSEDSKPIRYLNCRGAAETKKLMKFCSGPVRQKYSDATFIDLFQKQAKSAPHRIALEYENTQLTYDQLIRICRRNALILQKDFQVKKDQPVVIISNRNDKMLIGILSILFAGAGYVPAEPDTPIDRLKYIVNDTRTPCLVVDPVCFDMNVDSGLPVFIIDNSLSNTDLDDTGIENAMLNSPVKKDTLAYIIYTSGSTGRPKGVMIEHGGMLNHLFAKIEDLKMTPNSVVAQTASYTFDISVWQMLSVLLIGAKVVIYPNEIVRNPAKMCEKIYEQKITVLQVVPSYLTLLFQTGYSPAQLSSLKYLVVTGETLPVNLLRTWFERYPSIAVVNAYGPTEASDDITHCIFHRAPENHNVPIGSPIRNLSIYIINKWGTIMPVGVKGEIVVAGIGVGRGYLNDNRKTKKSFTRNKYTALFSKNTYKLYHTGDLGKWTNERELMFYGRMDDQVKIRGYRIELGEIEKNILQIPEIRQASVCIQTDNNGEKILIAYLQFKPNTFLEVPVVRDKLGLFIPQHMLPHRYIVLDEMPLTANGKIDKKKLLKMPIESKENDLLMPEQTALNSEHEKAVYRTWKEVLGYKIRADSTLNFFENGGDSFKAILLAAKLSKTYGAEFSIRDIFGNPTIREQARLIRERSGSKHSTMEIRHKEKSEFPMSPAQSGIYYQHYQLNGGTQYNITGCFTVSGLLNFDKVKNVLSQLVKRHSILRSTFHNEGGKLIQRIHNKAPEVEIVIYNYEKGEDFYPVEFELSMLPLFRVNLICGNKDQKQLIVEMHHIICDGFSVNLLMQEFQLIYNNNYPVSDALQYADYVMWSKEAEQEKKKKHQLEYWIEKLDNYSAEEIRFPFETLAGEKKSCYLDIEIKDEDFKRIRSFCKAGQITTGSFFLSAFTILIYQYTNQRELMIGMPVSGRSNEISHEIIGPFATFVPFIYSVGAAETIRNYINKIQQANIDALDNQEYSFAELVRKMRHKFSFGSDTLFDIAFSCEIVDKEFGQSLVISLGDQASLKLYAAPVQSRLKYKIYVTAMIYSDLIKVRLEYRADAITEETGRTLLENLRKLISEMLSDPDKKVSQIDLLAVSTDSIASVEDMPFNL